MRRPIEKIFKRITIIFDPQTSENYIAAVSLLFGVQIGSWAIFLSASKRSGSSNSSWIIGTVIVIILLGVSIFWVFLAVKRKKPGLFVASVFLSASLSLIGFFSALYWANGSPNNFSITLSHLDAIYFTLGTLTTGTGNIVPISELSRGLQSLQLVSDLALLVFGGGLVVSRLSDALR